MAKLIYTAISSLDGYVVIHLHYRFDGTAPR
jgi:hypothetical protein